MAELTETQLTVREMIDALTPESGILTAESIAALRGSPIGRILLPARYGGSAAASGEFVSMVGEFAVVDGSLGWLAAMFNAAADEVAGDELGDVVWGGDRDALIATSYRGGGELADGRLFGRWESVVGAGHADWLLLPVDGGRRALLPRAGVRVDTRGGHGGLDAAGIGDVTVSGWAVGRLVLEGAPARPAAVAGAALTAAVVGSAEGVWRKHVEQVRARLATSYGGEEVSDDAFAQVSWAASDIDAAKLQVAASLELPDGPAAHWAHQQAVARARGAADRLLSSSNHALDGSDPVTRRWRDVQAGCRLAVPLLHGLQAVGAGDYRS